MTLIGRSFTAVYRTTVRNAGEHRGEDATRAVGGEGSTLGTAADVLASEQPKYLDRLVVRQGNHAMIVDVAEILWLEAFGNYVRLHTSARTVTVRGTLATFERQLDPSSFVRIHRSAIVNRDAVRAVQPRRTGDFTLVLASGAELTLSRNFRNLVPEFRRRMAS